MDSSKGYEQLNALRSEIADINGQLSDIERAEQSKLDAKRREIQQRINEVDNEFNFMHQKQNAMEKEVEQKKAFLSANEDYLNKLKGDYSNEKARTMNEEANVCPVCGQAYPDEMKNKMVDAFEKDKEDNLLKINLAGKDVADSIKNDKATIDELVKQIEQIKDKKVAANGERNNLDKQLESVPLKITDTDLAEIQTYVELKSQLSAKETELSSFDTSTVDEKKNSLLEKKKSIQCEIEVAQKALNVKAVVEDAEKRVQELKVKLKETTQKVADCERLEFLLERFEKAKMDLLSERINKKFKLVQWKLWHQQKNGGFEPVCVCMVHGSAFGENTTSTTERLMAGLDIICTLQEIYETKAPIFIDNKESYNDWNIPQMDCQMVLLSVSDDKEIRVEVG
jgi:DNA repair exonuclease SbcCD ATPase subunit